VPTHTNKDWINMQPHDRTEFITTLTILIIITLAKHSSKLPDDGLLTEACSSISM